MTCDLCPAEAVVFAPGSEPVRDLFLLDAGEPLHCWCLACWPYRAKSETPRNGSGALRWSNQHAVTCGPPAADRRGCHSPCQGDQDHVETLAGAPRFSPGGRGASEPAE